MERDDGETNEPTIVKDAEYHRQIHIAQVSRYVFGNVAAVYPYRNRN